MKKIFEPADIEVILCPANDVVRTSGGTVLDEGERGDADIFGIVVGGGAA